MVEPASRQAMTMGGTGAGPRLSVGLAVYNGENYLEAAIDSILAQTFADFELIICDNASADRTQEICRRYADRDPRVRYVRNPTNIGGANNENLTFAHANGEYFRWAAHDDICGAELFARCVEVLDRDPEVVLCYTRTVEIDDTGAVTGENFQQKGTAATPSGRFRELSRRDHGCEATYGIVRSGALRTTGLQRNYTDSDRVLLCALAMHGPFVQLDEPLFFKRYHEKNKYNDWRARMSWFKPGTKQRFVLPHWLEAGHLAATAVGSPVPVGERIRSLGWVAVWVARHARQLVGDVVNPIRMIISPAARRRSKEWRYNWE